MIDIDTIIQNIEDKIHLLEKLKFDDDPKNFMYTPITAVTITSSTDFKQLECQKFMRCPRSNKLIPLGKFSDSIVALKDESFEGSKENGSDGKVVQKQNRINYRRNSIAYFDQKRIGGQKKEFVERKRRNSTKFDERNQLEVNNLSKNQQAMKNQSANELKRLKTFSENSNKSIKNLKSLIGQTSSPLIIQRTSASPKPIKETLISKSNLQQSQNPPANQKPTLNPRITGSSKFSKSYTEFLNSLNKEMQIFKQQQMRNEPCDNFLGKDAKIFVENPISKIIGDVKDVKSISSDVSEKKVDGGKINDNCEGVSMQRPKIRGKKSEFSSSVESNLKGTKSISSNSESSSTNETITRKSKTTEVKSLKTTNKEQNVKGFKANSSNSESLINEESNVKELKTPTIKSNPKSSNKKLIPSKPKQEYSDISKLPESLPTTPIYGKKYIVKAADSQSFMFGKILKIPQDSEMKTNKTTFNKLVMRRMTVDSGRSLLKQDSEPSSKIQKFQLQKATPISPIKTNSINAEKSAKKLQKLDLKIPKVNQELIHQKIVRLSPQKPQSANLMNPKSDKHCKSQQNVIRSLKYKIPRRNSIGFGVRIETASDIKRIKLDQDVKRSVSGLESIKNFSNGTQKEEKNDLAISISAENSEDFKKQKTKFSEDKFAISKKIAQRLEEKSKMLEKIRKIPEEVAPATSIDFEDELENISACHIDKLAPNGVVEDQNKELIDSKLADSQFDSASRKNASHKKLRIKIKFDAKNLEADDKLMKHKIMNKDDKPTQKIRKRNLKIKKGMVIDQKSIKAFDCDNNDIKIMDTVDLKETVTNGSGSTFTPDSECEIISNDDQKSNLVSSEESKNDTVDELTARTMDIFRDIENYKNLIRQQSTESQRSNKSTNKESKIVETPAAVQVNQNLNSSNTSSLVGKIRIAGNLFKIDPEKNDDRKRKSSSESKRRQSVGAKMQKFNLTQDKSQFNSKAVNVQGSSETVQQNLNNELKTNVSSAQNSSQSPQSSQNSSILSNSQSSQLLDSLNTSNPDAEQSLGKRRRQINPKYSESEYMLKNTSKEFTNAIRGKMTLSKVQKNLKRKLSVMPEDQSINDDNLESSKPDDIQSSSQPSISPQKPTTSQTSSDLKCQICNKTFLRPKGLARHMPLHSSDRRYPCTKCDYRFLQRSDLTRHMLLHESSPSIPCPKCNKLFRTEGNLQSHMGTHEAPLPYKCDQCEVKFRSTKNLRYHLMSHHSGVKFQCGYCGSKFLDEKSLRVHVMQHENEDEDLDDEELEDYLDFMDEEASDSEDEPMVIAE